MAEALGASQERDLSPGERFYNVSLALEENCGNAGDHT